jgi:hypothetical protein
MIELTKLPVLNDNHEWLMDNEDYSELFERLNYNTCDYLIVYSYSSDFLEVIQELVQYNIEFSHHSCHLSDESYLLIDTRQE